MCSVTDKLSQLGERVDEARWSSLRELARLTALKRSPNGQVHLGHWWRGPLLYALVRRYRPRQVLEFGMGRGYGAVCMAQAAIDAGFECTVWTIDVVPPSYRQPWLLDEGSGAQLRSLSVQEVWEQHISTAVRQRVRWVTGESAVVMKRWIKQGRPRIDFCFLDAGHDYWAVKQDWMTALRIANPGCGMLFDDYTDRRTYGVKRLIDREIQPKLPGRVVEIVTMRSHDHTPYDEHLEHEMAWLSGEYIGDDPLKQFYSDSEIWRFERAYRWRAHTQRLERGLRSAVRRLVSSSKGGRRTT